MAHDVFISYSIKDKPVADATCATLEAQGIRCWVAPRDVLPGMDWGDSIIQAVTESSVMVLIFSSSANESVQIKREVNQAIEKEVPVIPFRIENVAPSGSLEYYLDVTHWLDAVTPPIEQHLEKLAGTVALLLKRTVTSHASPLLRKAAPESQHEPTRNRKKLLWIGGAVVAVLLAILVGVMIERENRYRRDNNAPGVPNGQPTPPRGSATGATPDPTSRQPPMNIEVKQPAQEDKSNSISDRCIPGFVWRETRPNDHVCVTPEVRAKAVRQNELAASRKNPEGGPWGPDTCLQGFVWREAFKGDHVCVTVEERDEAARDNEQASARVVR